MPLDLNLWQARIDQSKLFRKVGVAADFAAARAEYRTTPVAFLIPQAGAPGKNILGTEGVHQTETETVAILLAVKHLGSSSGAQHLDELREKRLALRDLLVAWQPADADSPVEAAAGRLQQFNESTIWWQDSYRTTTSIYHPGVQQ